MSWIGENAMVTQTIPVILPAENIVATGVSADEYMAQYAETFHEWVEGMVIKMSPVTQKHDALSAYLRMVIAAYLRLNPIGKVVGDPFTMRMDTIGRIREPDLQIILNDNPGQFTDTAMIGAADICIEVVSPESVARDYGDKFVEYEKAGVREYWIVDPIRQRCQFNRLESGNVYTAITVDANGIYQTPRLPKLALHVPTLWRDPLPDILMIVEAVQSMFTD
jgi:Uma2 family endonuclease